jgi:glycosyltransferase involved in cell wall biosynthesis
MRVLMLSKACVVGIYQRKLEEIARQGIDLLLLVPPTWTDERGTLALERVYTSGYRLETTPIWLNGSFHLHFYPQLGRWLRAFQPDIVHIDEEPYNLATWLALRQARRSGAKTLFFSWQNIARAYPFPFKHIERHVLENVDYALMGTESAAAVWREKGYTGPLRIIPQFGVDPELFQPAAHSPNRPFTIGYFGRLVEEKGLLLLLDALARLRDPRWRLQLVGGGPLRAELETKARSLGLGNRVQFCDQIPSTRMPAQYHDLDAFVLPSLTRPNWKEQFGRVLVEAMSSGVPVIGSDSGAIPGVIGDAGLIFAEGDSAALAACIERLQQDSALRSQLAGQGRQRVLDHFTHQRIAQASVEVYEMMVK